MCDALLGDSSGPAVVLEVEGSRYAYTMQKIGRFFAAEYPELSPLSTGILVAYAYEPEAGGLTVASPRFRKKS